ncbi:MAG: orotate phosphoribosyltransferase [Elusimicrobiota bacterium]|jgi:orotate phosphoribosyltransferase|nr:orotate phosphoribosyltransferase [Elusimicrobiota bacterium]
MAKKNKIDLISILQETEAASEGHFELPCGLHIQSYIDTNVVMQYPSLAALVAGALADLFDKHIDIVFSPSAENSVIAQEVARVKNARAIFSVLENGAMTLKGGMQIKPGEQVLIVDNVTMTGRKVNEAAGLVKILKGNVVGVAVIVDRSEGGALGNVPLRSLLSYPLDSYQPHNCPMCKSGVKLIKKGGKK